ncbi:SNARE associated Golgi protein [Anatilimnocola aggregata]|uniref:SNARE associated Golgi protein n=1 Tax=Anatilimnocola aggregata TaxID=2528021 RepID=A0A517YDT8_9BACT|nr:SNARE associated Golgi protein [Anatilimnocola aggregata]
MRDILRPMLPMIVVLAIPLVPLTLLGFDWQDQIGEWGKSRESQALTAAAIIGLLASDIFLPIPSSVLCTAAGWQLGVLLGTLVAWLGMSLGAALGFALARGIGAPLVAWLTTQSDLERAEELTRKLGPWLLVVGRGIPVVAEASVLFVGMHQMRWRTFLPPVLLSNLGLALAYAAFGQFAERYQWLPLALGVSIALPVLMAAAFSAWMRGKQSAGP